MKDRIVLGTWSLSGDFGHVGLRHIEEVLEYAYERGFKEYDTAPNYGNGFMEFCLGKIFRGKSDARINTKFGNMPFHGKSFSRDELARSVDQSLLRLKTDVINVLFLHNPRTEVTDFEDLFDLFENLKAEGKILKSGLSMAKGFGYRDQDLVGFDVLQNDYNLLYLSPVPEAVLERVVFMARSPMASGILSGLLQPDACFAADDHRSGWLKGERLASICRRVEAIRAVQTELDLPQLAKRFVLQSPAVGKMICGIKHKEHIDTLIDDLQAPPISKQVVARLEELYRTDFGLQNQKHLGY